MGYRDYIYYKFWATGLINQVMSIELAAGIQTMTNKKIVMHGMHRHVFTPSNYFKNQKKKYICDLLDWNNKDQFIFIDENIDKFSHEIEEIEDLMKYYFSCNPTNDQRELLFAEGRTPLPNNLSFMHLKGTLAPYSRFFYNRTWDLDFCLKSVRFKPKYYAMAQRIKNTIGEFDGIHLRLTDHSIRMFNVTAEMFEESIKVFDNRYLPLVICTDNLDSNLLKLIKKPYIVLEDYIFSNFMKDLVDLDMDDDVSLGLISNLVMHHSTKFLGTPGSTFTAYIQRNRIQNGLEEDFLVIGEKYPEPSGPFSWNGIPIDIDAKNWWREWKECQIPIEYFVI